MGKTNNELDQLMETATGLTKGPKHIKRSVTRKPAKEPSVQVEALKLVENTLAAAEFAATQKIKMAQEQYATPATVYAAFQVFEGAVGGRAKLLETLAHCPDNSAGYNMMQRLVLDPAFLDLVQNEKDEEKLKFSLEAICSKHKIPFNALVTGFRDARVAQITLSALMTVGAKSQQVVEQLGEAATDRWTQCTNCQGKRRVKRIGDNGEFAVNEMGDFVTQLCWICRGEGKVFAAHDWQNRSKFLEIVGITKKESLIQQTFDHRSVNIGSGATGMEGTMKALDNLLRGKAPAAVESEVIDVQPISNK